MYINILKNSNKACKPILYGNHYEGSWFLVQKLVGLMSADESDLFRPSTSALKVQRTFKFLKIIKKKWLNSNHCISNKMNLSAW